MNREGYLLRMTEEMRPWFADVGFPVPRVHVSVGFPCRRPLSGTLGECFGPQLSADGIHQVFISPLIGDGLHAADVLVHELVHAAVGVEHGHRGMFVRAMLAVGLTGNPRSTVAGDRLKGRLNALLEELGPYPHPELKVTATAKQSARLLPVACAGCSYRAWVTRKWLVAAGAPICPTCRSSMRED